MKQIFKLFAIILLFFVLMNCKKVKVDDSNNEIVKETNPISKVGYIILNSFPHDINSFTEGLFMSNNIVYESTGSPEDIPSAKSVMGILDLKTGFIQTKIELNRNIYFGEGIAKCNNKIYQLTYKNKTGFIYDSKTFKQIGIFQFDNNEGWGLTNVNNESLILSDGTNILTFLDPENLKFIKKLEVFENNNPISNLNELEYVDGYIYANIFTTNKIVKIDPKRGNVVSTIDLSSLFYDAKNKFPGSLEMNGIAYNNKNKTFLITGKLWPCVYEIKLNK
jgi:glutamine cyclotransferase